METKIKIDKEEQVWLSFCGDITETVVVLNLNELNILYQLIKNILMETLDI